MIVRMEVEGRQATVNYVLVKDLEPTTEEKAEAVVILFDDGERRFAVREKAE